MPLPKTAFIWHNNGNNNHLKGAEVRQRASDAAFRADPRAASIFHATTPHRVALFCLGNQPPPPGHL